MRLQLVTTWGSGPALPRNRMSAAKAWSTSVQLATSRKHGLAGGSRFLLGGLCGLRFSIQAILPLEDTG